MGVRVHSNVEAEFGAFLTAKEAKLYAVLAESMVVIMHEAEWEAKGITAQQERIDTGAMFDAISSRVEFNARRIVGEAGFIGDQQDYYVYQTVTGFQHWLSGDFIGPTGALAVAGSKAYADTVAAIAAAIASA